MLLFALFFSWIVFAHTALASGAYGYETVFFYYAYLMDYKATGGVSTIASGCGSSKGPCSLDDFIRKIQFIKAGSTVPYTGNNLGSIPDPLRAGQTIQAGGFDYNGVFDQESLLPEFKKVRQPQGTILQTMTDKAQAALVKVGASGLSTELDGMQKAMNYALAARNADQAKNVISALKARRPAITVKTTTVTNPDGTSYEALDVDQTVAANRPAANKPDNEGFLRGWVQSYISQNTQKDKGLSHQNVLNAAQQSNSRLVKYSTTGCFK